jgi:RHS repeat-associated protein
MTIYPATLLGSGSRHRPGRRFRPRPARTVVLGSATALLIQLTGAPAPASAATAAVSYTYDAAGRLATVTNSAGTATYHYDAEGNLLSVSESAAGPRQTALPHHQGLPRPAISSASPSVVAPGKAITITGRGFSAAKAKDTVRVGDLMAPVSSASATELRITAPPGTGGKVAVTTPGGTAHGPKVKITEPRQLREPAPGRDPHPLRAAPGVTGLSGLVETNQGAVLPGVSVTVASVAGKTQETTRARRDGQFLFTNLAPGRHQLIITATSVASVDYGVYAEPVELPKGQTTVMPWVTYLTPLDLAHAITIGSPASHEVNVTSPKLPGLIIQIPKGTVIRDRNGHVVTKVSLTPLTVGRTAYPLAPGMQPGFFTLQPGDATVSGPGLRVVYANASDQPPGTAIPYFVDSPDWAGTGWWRYGTGHVSANGKQIDPAPGARWHLITLGGYSTDPPPYPNPAPCPGPPPPGGGGGGGGGSNGPPPAGPSCPAGGGGGDPISLATGLFVDDETDLTLNDVESVPLMRTFRQLDDTVRDFGIGMSSSLNFYIVANGSGDFNLYNPAGGVITYAPTSTTGVYQAVGSPTEFVGSTLTWTSGDPDGPFTVNLTDGAVLSFDNPAYLTAITDRFGNTITINRNELTSNGGQISTVTTPDGLWLQFTYGNCVTASPGTTCITQVTDNSGRTVNYSYDAFGRLTTVTNPAGGVTKYAWTACTTSVTCTELLSTTDPDGHVTSNTYSPTTGWVTGQTDGDGNTWSYSYVSNSSGQVTQATVTDPRGIKDQYSFSSSGLPSSVTYGLGSSDPQTVKASFSSTTNLLTSETDALGRTTDYAYDALGNLASITYLAGTSSAAIWSYKYDPVYSRITSVTNPLGFTTTIAYNDAAQTETLTDPLGRKWVTTLNDEGQPIEQTNPLGGTTYLSYLYGDLVAISNPLGETTGAYYDSVGQLLDITDAEGNTESYTWTPLGQMASETNPLGGVTSYGHDADGNLTSVTDADGHKTSYSYNHDSELATKTDPLGKVTSYSYDGDGDLTKITDAMANVDTFAYDDFGNLTTALYGVSGSTQQTKIVYTYDNGNRMTKAVQTPGGTYSLSYDGLNDVLSQTGPAGTVSRTYNAAGLPTSMTVPGQTKITYSYDNDDQLTGITQGTATVAQTWDDLSRLSSVTLPDGIKDTSTYDAANELTAQTFQKGSTTVGALSYSYTPDSQISSESGSLASTTLPAAVSSNTYNADNELTSANGTSYSYNADGDLTSTGTSTYAWNAQNQLTGISGATTAAFTYNPFGQQATVTIGGTATSYLYDGIASDSNVVQEQSGGTPTANLLTGAPGQLFQFTTPSGTNDSLLTSPLGSTIALAGSTGAISTSYSYTPGGVATASGASSPNTFEFNATQNNRTGLYLMGARYYDPATGTFISQDPTGFTNGSTNLYGYAGNDPVNHGDPTGCGAKSFNCYKNQFLWNLGIGLVAGLVGVAVAVAIPIVLAGTALAAATVTVIAAAGGVVATAVVNAVGQTLLNYLIDTNPACQ